MSKRITLCLNDDDPRHIEILEWLEGFSSTTDKYRSRAVSLQIIATLHAHVKRLPKKTKQALVAQKENAPPKSVKPKESSSRTDRVVAIEQEDVVSRSTLSSANNDTIDRHEPIKITENTPAPRCEPSSKLSRTIMNNMFDDDDD